MFYLPKIIIYLYIILQFVYKINGYIYPLCDREGGVCVGENYKIEDPEPTMSEALLSSIFFPLNCIFCPMFLASQELYDCFLRRLFIKQTEIEMAPLTFIETIWVWLGYEVIPQQSIVVKQCSYYAITVGVVILLIAAGFIYLTKKMADYFREGYESHLSRNSEGDFNYSLGSQICVCKINDENNI
ncbi:unnamed protein product [Brassicogethes aeneus]|uniref:Uncharacterized protein n=1 Tax=Brassicogethes aeneus TaxID=1431903 RepID=A0A9P0FC00_BRAAE|nr:unnamed protein product [Brassicogethes aeneus]